MHTLGYRFRPWTAAKSIADGESILDYVRATARDAGIDTKVRFGHRVIKSSWSSEEARWTVTAERGDGTEVTISAAFIMNCSGYYRYDEGFTPEFPGLEDFGGRVIHPQHWPEEPEYEGKRVVVIGSGATAVTLVPAMATDAAHVTMLQRSPSYILSLPSTDPILRGLRRWLPAPIAVRLARVKNMGLQVAIYQFAQRAPRAARRVLEGAVRKQLPPGYPVEKHFHPVYDPWDQRLCLVPDGDLFAAISAGTASVVTDTIETFTETGIRLASGAELDADVVVSATGLSLLAVGGISLAVDGRAVELSDTVAYKGMMLTGVPNFALTIGYTNASWTLKADLVSEYVCRLLAEMERIGATVVTPQDPPPGPRDPLLSLQANYIKRGVDRLPRQARSGPWKLNQNYAKDVLLFRHGPVTDAVEFR
jgi:cation diffusion facilitator CzcD-associated flavoprotein CzcO